MESLKLFSGNLSRFFLLAWATKSDKNSDNKCMVIRLVINIYLILIQTCDNVQVCVVLIIYLYAALYQLQN